MNSFQEDGFPREQQHPASGFIGRRAEFLVIKRRIDRLMEGQGRFVSLIGEAGIGKSRLVYELASVVCGAHAALPIQWIVGSSLSMDRVISYWMFRQIIWHYAEITEQDEEDVAWNKLRRLLDTLFHENSSDLLPYLASMIALRVKGEYVEQIKYLTGEAMRRQIFFATRRLFEKMAETKPLVLVLDDLQWIDEASAALLEHLLPLIYRTPILILGVARPSVDSPHAKICDVMTKIYHDRYDEIRVPPLSPSESAQLVSNLLGDEHHAPPIAEKIVEKVGGNPLFIEEAVRSFIHGGIVHQQVSLNDVQQPPGQIEVLKIPLAVQDIIAGRVGMLDERLKGIVRIAAVIGRSFLYRVVLVVAQSKLDLPGQLQRLQKLGLVLQDFSRAELTYMFGHDLIHEVIYQSIDHEERKALHAVVGAAIERLFDARLEEFYAILAYHYSQAQEWEKALEYLLKAGDQAGTVAADSEALAHYAEAVQACASAIGRSWSPLQQASLERKMGEALFRSGRNEDAAVSLGKALAQLGKPLPRSAWGRRKSLVYELLSQLWTRLRGSHCPINETVPAEVEEEIRIREVGCWISSYRDGEQFLLHSVALLNVSERKGYVYGMGLGYAATAITLDFGHMFRFAQLYLRLAKKFASRVDHPMAKAYVYMALGVHHSTLAQWSQAFNFSRNAEQWFKKAGDLRGWAYVTHLQCCALAYLGNYDSALGLCQTMYRVMADAGDVEATSWGKWVEGYCLRNCKHFQEAERCFKEARGLARAVANPVYEVVSVHELTLIYLSRDALDMALEYAETLETMLLHTRTDQILSVPSHNAVTATYLRAAEESGGTERDVWMEKARMACKNALIQCKGCYLLRPEAMRLQGVLHWLTGRQRAALRFWKRGLALAEQSGQRYDMAAILREIGNRLSDRESIERSDEISKKIGIP